MLKRFLAGLLIAASASTPAWATCGSTINPTAPAQGALIASPPIRSNFAAAYSDINNLFSNEYGGSAPTDPCVGQTWLNSSTTPASMQQWDGTQWVTIYALSTTAHTASIPAGSLPVGTSVNIPGTGKIEALLPPSSVTQSSYAFGSADLFKKTRRSNGGTAMTDTLPAASVAGMVNGAQINIANVDASAADTLSAGSGTTIDGNSTLAVQPGRDVWLTYDAANTAWRGVANTKSAVLFTGTPPNASQLFGGSTTPGSASAVAVGSCLTLAGGVLNNSCGGTLTGPGPAPAGYLPQWSGTAGLALGVGMPVGPTGSYTVVATNGSGQIAPSIIPAPTASTLGGVESIASLSNNWITYIDTSGVPHQSQPGFGNLSGSAACGQLPAMTGAVTTSAGSCATSIAASGVTAASYSNANITIGADGRVTAASNGSGSAYPSNFLNRYANYTASGGDNIFADTSGGGFTITLPASPSEFTQLCITDAAGDFGIAGDTLTINPNGLYLMGSLSNMTVTTSNVSFCLMYYSSTPGWRIK